MIELIVVMAVFLLIIGGAVGIFISIIGSQRRLLYEQELLNQTSYIEEHISKVLNWFEVEAIKPGSERFDVYKGMLTNYFEAYLIAETVCRGADTTDARILLKRTIKYARHMFILGRLSRPEAISIPIFKNALLSLAENKSLPKLQEQLEGLC